MFDIIKSNSIIRPNFLSKLKTAARISKTDYFWIKFDNANIDLAWQPEKHDKEYIHVFGSDLNHIQAIFANKDKLKQLEQFSDFKLHTIETNSFEQNIIEVDGLITTELLFNLQEKQDTEWFWVVNKNYDYSDIDLTWREDPWTNPRLYAYGNQDQGYKAYLLHKKTDVYGETVKREYKFKPVYDLIDNDMVIRKTMLQKLKMAARISTKDCFYITSKAFDMDPYWEPNLGEQNFIHVFGSDLNHIQAVFATKTKIKQLDEFKDFKLHTIPNRPFTQDILEVDGPITSELLVNIQETQTSEWIWIVNKYFDYSDIDFTWREDPWTDPKLYAYGNKEQGYKAYLLHKKTNIYGETVHNEFKFKRLYDIIDNESIIRKTLLQKLKTAGRSSSETNFYLCNREFKIDPYWEPAVGEEDYIHVFGSDLNHIQAIYASKDKVKQLDEFKDYVHHKIDNITFAQNIIEVDHPITLELLVNLQENQDTEWFWVVNKYFDYSEIDFTWREDPWNDPKLYAYGNNEQGYKAYLLHKKTDVYGLLEQRDQKFNRLFDQFDSETIIRKSLLQKIKAAARASLHDHVWINHRNHCINPDWFPDLGEENFIHLFGPDLNHIQAIWFNKNTVKNLKKFENFKLHTCDIKNYHNVVHLAKNIEVSDLKEIQTAMSDEWIWVVESHYDYSKFDFAWRPDPWNEYNWYNFNNKAYLIHQFSDLDKIYDLKLEKFNRVTVPIIQIDTLQNGTGIEYKNYSDAIKQAIKTAPYSLFWLVANHIDASKFDFTWFPEYSDLNYLHCWATGEQDKGDLFFVNKDSINLEHDDLFKMAEIKFHDSNIPAVKYNVTGDYTDDLPKLIKETEFNLPWNFVRNMDSELNVKWQWPQPCYWYGPRIETYGDNNSVILYHKDVVKEIKTEIYDFPTIIKNRRLASYDKKLDVIFLSNEEYFAQSNLLWLKSFCPRVKHIRGVTGRANSYKAMAQASRTQWFFAVFSKLHVAKDFDFDWRPDRLQAPKHYIFKATNTMNGLEYGHMAIVAANKNIVLNQTDYELDFTMGGAHTLVDVNSGVAYFNESPMATWRTAFRECVKLTHAIQQNSLDMESFDRLNVWMTRADGHYADYCLMGANDGYEYAKKNEGNLDALKLTREWDWLEKYFIDRHSRQQP